MRRHVPDLIVLGAVATGVAIYLVVSEPGWRSIVIRAYIFVVGALVMLVLVAAAGDAFPRRRRSDFDRALAAAEVPTPKVNELERAQREVTLALGSAHDLHFKLIPHLREIAQARLERAGRRPSEETLGRWWELLRPDREPPVDRFETGIKLAELRECLDDLARIT
ncbi:MAG TPA: hypothetical protein VGU02_09950 [Gaiellaceae bacterium]|nr:hypothetical protein [Gaiellaceae bacterium]